MIGVLALERTLRAIGFTLPALLLLCVLVIVSADVVARGILEIPFYTAHDLALIAFAGVVWFGLVGSFIRDEVFGVRVAVDLLPGRLRDAARILARLLVVAISVAVIHSCLAQIRTSRFTTFLALGWPKWIIPAGLAVAMAIVILVEILALVSHVSRLRR